MLLAFCTMQIRYLGCLFECIHRFIATTLSLWLCHFLNYMWLESVCSLVHSANFGSSNHLLLQRNKIPVCRFSTALLRDIISFCAMQIRILCCPLEWSHRFRRDHCQEDFLGSATQRASGLMHMCVIVLGSIKELPTSGCVCFEL